MHHGILCAGHQTFEATAGATMMQLVCKADVVVNIV